MKINANAPFESWSGLTLLSALALALGLVTDARADYPNGIADYEDFYQGGQAGLGLPAWRVSAPFTSLWIQYPAARYTTSAGKTVSLDVAFRQRGANTGAGASNFGPNWQCSWFSTATYAIEYDIDLQKWFFYDPVYVSPPLGGTLTYTSNSGIKEYNTYSELVHSLVQGGSCPGVGITVSYPDGTQYGYDYMACASYP